MQLTKLESVFAGAVLLACVMAQPSAAQSLSASVALYKSAYDGGDYERTRGDWQGEATLRYHFSGPVRLGAGVSVGKLDEPYSDPSFTSVSAYVEPSLTGQLGSRFAGWVGGRYGWAHERVGEREDGLWGWGWEAGGAAGVEYSLRQSVGVGIQAEVMRLHLGRDEEVATPDSGFDRRGWRFSLGLGLRLGGPY